MHIIRQLEAIKLFNLKTTKLVNVKWSKVSLFQRNVIICDRNIVQFPPLILVSYEQFFDQPLNQIFVVLPPIANIDVGDCDD